MRKLVPFLFLFLLVIPFGVASAQTTNNATDITYQGYLELNGLPVTDTCDFRFDLYSALTGGSQVFLPIYYVGVEVTEGVFSVQLDFGSSAFNGEDRWLQISVNDCNGGLDFTALSPRQVITPAAYAIYASQSSWSGLSGIPSGFADGIDNDNDTTYTAGSGLTLNAGQFSVAGNSFWETDGNTGITDNLHFIGTTDSHALDFRVNSTRAFRLEPNGNGANVIGGHPNNDVTDGAYGATISGGGATQRVTDSYGTVGGGLNNTAGNNNADTSDVQYATVGGGDNNTASGWASTIAGGELNEVTLNTGFIGGGYDNSITAENGVIGGGVQNKITAQYGTIGGGGDINDTNNGNWVSDEWGTIGGGIDNQAGDATAPTTNAGYATVGGGISNTASGPSSTVGGGISNVASGDRSAVFGGQGNNASDLHSFVGGGNSNTASNESAAITGGWDNTASGNYSFIGGGNTNLATDDYSVVAGGSSNRAGNNDADTTNAQYATVGGGKTNIASGSNSVVVGGELNVASGGSSFIGSGYNNNATNTYSIVVGGENNTVSAQYGFIGGGGNSTAANANLVTDNWGTVGGGQNNQAGSDDGTLTNAQYATVGGGIDNSATGISTIVGGGQNNTASGNYTVISGGVNNIASGGGSVVGGGNANNASGTSTIIAGGVSNTTSALGATVGGGNVNNASGSYGTISGGQSNTASGQFSMIPGGLTNTAAGDYSFAGGRRAVINPAHDGAFLWADQNNADFNSEAANEFAVRATGGVRFETNTATTTGCSIAAGGIAWSCSSDRNVKDAFMDIDSREILEAVANMPVTTWEVIGTDTRHIGPMAQDFYAAFGVGDNDVTISTVDANGVAFAAIQGLNLELQDRDTQIAALNSQLSLMTLISIAGVLMGGLSLLVLARKHLR